MTIDRRRITATLTALVAVGLVLAGCSSPGGTTDGKGEFTFTFPTVTSGTSPYEELANAYEKDNPDVSVALTPLPLDSYSQTLLTQMRGGNGPDVLMTSPGTGQQNSILALTEANLLAPVDDSAKELLTPGSEDLFMVDGKMYGVPQGISVSGLVVAGAGLQPLGIDPFPTTTEELISTCDRLAGMGMSFVVLAGGAPPNTGLAAMTLAAASVYADDPDWNAQRAAGDVTFADSDGWHEALDTFIELNEGGCFQEGAAGAGFEVITNNLQQQKAVGAFIPGNTVNELVTAAPDANWLVEPFPTSTGKPFGLINTPLAISVNADGANKEAALDFAKWAAEPAQAELIAKLTNALPSVGYADLDLSSTVYAPVAGILKDGAFITEPTATWPDASVYDALSIGVQGLLTGQKTTDQVLADMDAAWDR